MQNITQKKIYLPKTIKTLFQTYSNGYVMWFSGLNALNLNYLNNTNKIKINLNLTEKDQKIKMEQSKVTNVQNIYKINKIKKANENKKYINWLAMQLQKRLHSTTAEYKKYLVMRGVGYKFERTKNVLTINVGYSHKINIRLPYTLKTRLSRKSVRLKLKCKNLERLTGYISMVRKFKKPDVYKGKGIRYRRDKVQRKEGKKKKSF